MNQILRRASGLVLAGACALVVAGAQTPAAPAKAPLQQPSTPQVRLDALIERLDKANEDFSAEWQKEMTQEERGELYAVRPGLDFVPEFDALAVEAKGTDVAAKARMRVFAIQLDFQKKPECAATLELILDESVTSKELGDLPSMLQGYSRMGGKERVTNSLELLLEKNPNAAVKAGSLFSLGEMLCAGEPSETQMAKGRKYFERVIAEFPTAKGPNGSYKEAAEGFLFAVDNLQIGKQAPDFEVTDENGTKFKLSDYRGKVVVIDFWGMW